MKNDLACLVCGGVAKWAFTAWDDRYGYPGQFALLRCTSCSHIFLENNFSSDQLVELYTKYYPRKSFDIEQCRPYEEDTGFNAWFNGLNSKAFRWVKKNIRVLDVGCGFGQSLGYHIARGCDAYGVEADENISRVADRFGYKVHVGLFDDSIYEAMFFDCITMEQVIEHITDPLLTLKGMARILKPGGTIILSTPNAGGWGAKLFGKRWINWHAPYHLQLFSRQSIQRAAEQNGLFLVKTKTITNSEWLYYQWLHLLTYPKLGDASLFWSLNLGGTNLNFLPRSLMKLTRLLHLVKINHVLTRIFDSLSLGDNYLFVLKKI